jgi:hypothetical protein
MQWHVDYCDDSPKRQHRIKHPCRTVPPKTIIGNPAGRSFVQGHAGCEKLGKGKCEEIIVWTARRAQIGARRSVHPRREHNTRCNYNNQTRISRRMLDQSYGLSCDLEQGNHRQQGLTPRVGSLIRKLGAFVGNICIRRGSKCGLCLGFGGFFIGDGFYVGVGNPIAQVMCICKRF